MMEKENQMIMGMQGPLSHAQSCRFVKDPKAECCEPLIKNFNLYNQQSYKSQVVDLPFDIGHKHESQSTITIENSDIASQFSESSRGAGSKADSQMSMVDKML